MMDRLIERTDLSREPTYREILNIKTEKRAWEVLAFLGQNRIIERPTYRVCLCKSNILSKNNTFFSFSQKATLNKLFISHRLHICSSIILYISQCMHFL